MSSSNRKILAVGAAGKFAGLVIPELVKRGATVRGLTDDPRHADVVRKNGAAEVAVGDLRDIASLRDALQGMDGVYYISPVFAPDQVEMGRNMVKAAVSAGVGRIVFSSVIHPMLTAIDNHVAKGPVEEAIVGSDLEYTILHPVMFFQNFAEAWPQVTKSGVLAEPYSADSRMGRVDFRDVAEVAAIALTEDRLTHGTFELCADGNLDRHAVAKIMGEVLGRAIEVEAPLFEEWVEKAGIPENGPVRPGMKQMYEWYDAHGFSGNSLTLRAILGREPRTLRAYLEELASGGRD